MKIKTTTKRAVRDARTKVQTKPADCKLEINRWSRVFPELAILGKRA